MLTTNYLTAITSELIRKCPSSLGHVKHPQQPSPTGPAITLMIRSHVGAYGCIFCTGTKCVFSSGGTWSGTSTSSYDPGSASFE